MSEKVEGNSSFTEEGRPLVQQEADITITTASPKVNHSTFGHTLSSAQASENGDDQRRSGAGETQPVSYGATQDRTESDPGTTTGGGSPGRVVRRPSQLTNKNKLDPELLVKKTRVAQTGDKELLVSRFNTTQARTVVSDPTITNKPFTRVGAHLGESDFDDYGQWVSEANNTFDSLDFDDYETLVLQEARAKKDGNVDPPKWQKWLIILLAGVLTGLVAFGINEGIYYLMYLKFWVAGQFLTTPSQKFYSNITTSDWFNRTEASDEMEAGTAIVAYTAINLVYVSVAACLVIFGEPLAKGSGIGEIKCFLNGIKLSRVVRLKTLGCKAFGILFSVASGLPCGKEGPMIHSGAAIAAGVSTGKSSKFHFDSGFFKEFRSDRDKRNFVTAGAAAGVGVAFGAPIGGLLFAVEEVGSFWSLELTFMVFLCAAIAPWTLQIVSHPTGVPSAHGLIDFGTVVGEYNYYDLPFVALLGVLGALVGTAFIKLNMVQTKWRKVHCKTKARRFIEVLIISALVSLGLIVLVCYGYTCIPIPEADGKNAALLKDIKQYGCYKDEYNDMATYFFRSMEDTIHLLTHSNEMIHYKTLLLHFAIFYPLTIMTYGIHVPSGLFLPTLALGCTLGHIYAQLWNQVLPDTLYLNPSNYALFGATAVLGGLVRMTISVIVIIMEATANTTFFYPLALVTVICKMVGDRFTHGIYDEHIFLNHIPLLETRMERPEMNMMCAGDVMNSDCVLVKEMLSVSDLITCLKVHPFCNSIIVVDSDGALKGVLLRRTALILIDKHAWEIDLTLEDFKKTAKEREYLKLKKYQFFERVPASADHKLIDLRRYIDLWPYTFLATTPLPRVYRTFKELGLRHIIVVNNFRQPIGIVGRKQLTYLEMTDARTLPPQAPRPTHNSLNLTHHPLSATDLENDASPVTLTSWRALDKWQEAYRKGVN